MRKSLAMTAFGVFSAFALAASASGCNGGAALGADSVSSPPADIPNGSVSPDNGSTTHPPSRDVVGESCSSPDPGKMCVALKYVVYNDEAGKPVVSSGEAINVVRQMNSVWAQCDLGFQIDEYAEVNPGDYGLRFGTANLSELDAIRGTFENDRTLLVVITGPWDRSGTLGNTGANAWTNMPGGSVFGAILESPVGTYANIIAHELGHYLNLDHVSDQSDLMNPVIYSTSTNLYASQCSAARSAVNYFWPKMKR